MPKQRGRDLLHSADERCLPRTLWGNRRERCGISLLPSSKCANRSGGGAAVVSGGQRVLIDRIARPEEGEGDLPLLLFGGWAGLHAVGPIMSTSSAGPFPLAMVPTPPDFAGLPGIPTTGFALLPARPPRFWNGCTLPTPCWHGPPALPREKPPRVSNEFERSNRV